MRKSLQLTVALVLALLFAAPVTAAGPGGATVQTITGKLTTVHEDDFATGRERERYFVASGSSRVEVSFADGGPGGENGATVTVNGSRSGNTLHVASSTHARDFRIVAPAPVEALTSSTAGTMTTTTSGTSAPAPAVATSTVVAKSIAAVLINFTDLKTQPFTVSATQAALYNSTTSVKSFFQEESKGRMTVAGAVYGWYTIPATTTGCDWLNWITLGTNAATAAGVSLSAYTNVMFIFPQTSQCGFAGLGYVPGTYSLMNGNISVQVMTHELGHNFGLGHANARSCTVNGVAVTIAADASCTTVNYADPFGTMGNNALRHNPASQLGELGFLTDAEKVVGTPGNTYTIAPYFGPEGVKLVRIPRGDGSYFDMDIRATYGVFDTFAAGSPVVSGVSIRLGWGTASPTTSPRDTELLDTTPGTSSLLDAPLLVGRTMTDPVSTISITAMSLSSAGIVVRVREGIAPSAPATVTAAAAADASSVTLAWGAATDNVAVGSYRIARDGTVVATVGADTLSWTDAGVAASTSYTYTVTAIDTSSNAGPGASVPVTTPAGSAPASTPTPTPDPSATASPSVPPDPAPTPSPAPISAPASTDTQAPTAPGPLAATPATTTVSLSWGAASDDTGVTGYVVTRNGTKVAVASGTSWRDTGRAPLTTYTYTVSATDAAGNAGPVVDLAVRTTADTIRPSTPRYFHVMRRAGVYVTFGWARASDNVKVVRYLIYRVGRAAPVARTTSLSIRIWAAWGARYYVRAQDAAGNVSSTSIWVRGR